MNRSLSYLFVLGLLLPAPALSLPSDRDQPIHLEADRAQWDQMTGISVYEGNVVITQGSLRLAADTVTITMRDGDFQHLEAIGKPASFRYKPDADKEEINGTSLQIDYDVNANLMIMTTNARVVQAQDILTGDRIEYDLSRDLVKARTTGSGERVRITIQPKSTSAPQN